MESCVTINLGVLPSVLCEQRSLHATVRGQDWNLEASGSNPDFGPSENSWPQGTLIDESPPQSLHTYTETKLHSRASKQCKTLHVNSLAKQVTLHISKEAAQSHTKPTDTPKLTNGHCSALQRDNSGNKWLRTGIKKKRIKRNDDSLRDRDLWGNVKWPTFKSKASQRKKTKGNNRRKYLKR